MTASDKGPVRRDSEAGREIKYLKSQKYSRRRSHLYKVTKGLTETKRLRTIKIIMGNGIQTLKRERNIRLNIKISVK